MKLEITRRKHDLLCDKDKDQHDSHTNTDSNQHRTVILLYPSTSTPKTSTGNGEHINSLKKRNRLSAHIQNRSVLKRDRIRTSINQLKVRGHSDVLLTEDKPSTVRSNLLNITKIVSEDDGPFSHLDTLRKSKNNRKRDSRNNCGVGGIKLRNGHITSYTNKATSKGVLALTMDNKTRTAIV